MKTFGVFASFFIAVAICGYIIFFTELSRREAPFDCRMLVGGWHPDVPKQVIDKCKERT